MGSNVRAATATILAALALGFALAGCNPIGWIPAPPSHPPTPPEAVFNPAGVTLTAGTSQAGALATAPYPALPSAKAWRGPGGNQLGNFTSGANGPLAPQLASTSFDGEISGQPAHGADGLWRILAGDKIVTFDAHGNRTGSQPVGAFDQYAATLVASPDGHQLYFADAGGVACVGLDGTVLWRANDAAGREYRRMAVAPSGRVIVALFDPADTNAYAGVAALNADGSVAWEYTAAGQRFTYATVGPLGETALLASDGHALQLVGVDGQLRWSARTQYVDYDKPAFGIDGSVYLTTWNGAQYPKDARWYAEGFTPAGQARPVIAMPEQDGFGYAGYVGGPDGTLYTSSLVHYELRAYGPDGHLKWSSTALRGYALSLNARPDGSLIVISETGSGRAASKFGSDGALLWQAPGWQTGDVPPVFLDSGALLVAAYDEVRQINAAGGLDFSLRLDGPGIGSLLTDSAGNSYGQSGNLLLSLDPALNVRWRVSLPLNTVPTLLLTADDAVFVGYASSAQVYGSDGSFRRTLTLPASQQPQGAPLGYFIGADNTLFVTGVNDRQLYAYDLVSGQLRWTYTDETGCDTWVLDGLGNLYGVSSVWRVELYNWGDGTAYRKVPASQSLISLDRNGARRFKQPLPGLVGAALQVGPDGQVWVNLSDGTLQRYNPDGSGLVSMHAGTGLQLLAALDQGRALCQFSTVTAQAGAPFVPANLAQLNNAGGVAWQVATGLNAPLSCTVDAAGRAYIIGLDATGGVLKLLCLDASGQQLFDYPLPGSQQWYGANATPDAQGGLLLPISGLLRLAD